jgi:hypothetical protein
MIQSGLVILAFIAAFAFIAKKTAAIMKKEDACKACAFKEDSLNASNKAVDKV